MDNSCYCPPDENYSPPRYFFPSFSPLAYAHMPCLLGRQVIIIRNLIATLPFQIAVTFTLTIFSDKDNKFDRYTTQYFSSRGSCSARLPISTSDTSLKLPYAFYKKPLLKLRGWLIIYHVHHTIFNNILWAVSVTRHTFWYVWSHGLN